MVRTWAGARPLSWPEPARAMRSSSRFQSSRRRITNSSTLISSENNRMEQPLPDTDLVVSTPERVSFDYQVAGLGTRGVAQILDLLIVAALLFAVFFVAVAAASYTQSGTVGTLVFAFGAFVVVFGYFWISEALFSGQTLGKRAFRLRAVGDRGEPLTWMQAGIRNVVRIVDFLPYGYGVGVVVLFVNGRGKRLGDLAAGTVVVKDSDSIGLWQLARPAVTVRPPPPPPPPPPSPPSGVNYEFPAPPTPAAPAGSTMSPASRYSQRIDSMISSSVTSITSSTALRISSRASRTGMRTAIPSATVSRLAVLTGLPARHDMNMEGAPDGQTAITRVSGE